MPCDKPLVNQNEIPGLVTLLCSPLACHPREQPLLLQFPNRANILSRGFGRGLPWRPFVLQLLLRSLPFVHFKIEFSKWYNVCIAGLPIYTVEQLCSPFKGNCPWYQELVLQMTMRDLIGGWEGRVTTVASRRGSFRGGGTSSFSSRIVLLVAWGIPSVYFNSVRGTSFIFPSIF